MKIHPWISILLQALSVLNTYFYCSCSSTSVARRHMLTKKQDDGNLRTKPTSRKTERRNRLHWVLQLPKYAQAEPHFWELRVQGAWAKSQHSATSTAKIVFGTHFLCSPSLASNPTSYLLSSVSIYKSFGACLAPFLSGSLCIICSCTNHHFTGRKWD